MNLPALAKRIAVLFDILIMIVHSLSHSSWFPICFQLFNELRWLKVREYDGRVVRGQCQLHVAGRWHVADIQTENDG